MHLTRTLDAHVYAGYSIIYIHTTLSPENEPPFAWLRKVYDIFDQHLKYNLHLLYVIHASWWLRMAMSFMHAFVAFDRSWESKVIQLPHLVRLRMHACATNPDFLRSRVPMCRDLWSTCTGGSLQAELLRAGLASHA